MNHQPPKWADRLLEWFCRPELLEDLQGDLHESFFQKRDSGRLKQANFHFVWLVFRSFRYRTIQLNYPFKNSTTMMIKSNLKVAIRVFWRDKLNTGLNLFGLSLGITCFLLLGSYVKREMSYDYFNSKSDRIYRVWLKEIYNEDKIFFSSNTPLVFLPTLKENFAEFEEVIQLDYRNFLIGDGHDRTEESVAIISPEFFNVFDFEVVQGNKSNPLADRNNLVLTENYALKYFGTENPIGKSLTIQIEEELLQFIVTAIIKDVPKESSVQFDMAISKENGNLLYSKNSYTAWFNVSQETYVLVKPTASIATVEARMPEVVMQNLGDMVEPGVYNIGFLPLTDIHLNGDITVGYEPVANKDYVNILMAIAILVLTISCINYTTLAIGQSLTRNKEVGIRKVLGAFKGSLLRQYLTESILFFSVSIIVGSILAKLAVPSFNNLTGADISFNFEFWHLWLYVGLLLIIGISSGFYPAFILSRLKVISILKGGSGKNKSYLIRKGMVVFQIMITVFLITSSLIMNNQLNFMQSKDLGFNYDAAVSVELNSDPSARGIGGAISTAMEKGEVLKEKLSQYPNISDIGMGTHVFGSPGWAGLSYTDNTDTYRKFRFLVVDPYYFNTFKIKLEEGRGFDAENSSDKKNSIILNRRAVEYFGIEDPIGKQLPGNFDSHTIIGVTEDFNFSSLHFAVEPLIIAQSAVTIFAGIDDVGFNDSPIPKLIFNYTGAQLSEVKTILEKEWRASFPNEDLIFSFVDEDMKYQYATEKQMNRIVSVATVLSIVIASLGLLGLTIIVVNSRIKEISVRKVNGASELGIFIMLVKSFGSQLLVGVIFSIPITWWLMTNWLNDFAYSIPISLFTFLLGAVISVLVAFLVISYHSLKIARTNPAKTLRIE